MFIQVIVNNPNSSCGYFVETDADNECHHKIIKKKYVYIGGFTRFDNYCTLINMPFKNVLEWTYNSHYSFFLYRMWRL